MRIIELTDTEHKLILDGIGLDWQRTDQHRTTQRPGSMEESRLLDRQRALETIEKKLHQAPKQ